MALEFKLPDIGEGIAEGEIVKWLVREGDTVAEHQSIVEVMTDKATVEVPAPAAGRIVELRAKEGDTVPVGSVIFVLDSAAGAKPATAGGGKPASASGPKASAPAAQAPAAKPHAAPPATQPRPAAARSANGASKVASSPPSNTEEHTWEGGSGATIEFKLPDIGEGIAEGEIVKWLVREGDTVAEHQSVVEVMTDKATVEIPAPAAGKISKILAREGEVVPVGKAIFHLAGAGAAPVAAKTSTRETKPASPPPTGAQPPTRTDAPAQAGRAAPGDGRGAPARAPAARPSTGAAAGSKVLAVPSARRVAREMGIDLADVPATGRNGVVRRADVEGYAKEAAEATSAPAPRAPAGAPAGPGARPQAAPASVAPGQRETRVPFRGVRRKIAEAMVRSKFTAPHFTVVEEVDVTELVGLREKAKAIGAESGVKVTFMPFIMKATALALAKYPMLNARLDEAAGELVRFHYVDLGIAMDTEQGLIVPVVRDVQSKGILQLGAELAELAERTRAGKVRPDELKNSTFSITNAGNIGGTLATPIINFPDVAILGVHRIMKKPGVVETPQGDRIEVRQYMNFSCSVDHRLADGADGARFLVHLKRLLEAPGLLAL